MTARKVQYGERCIAEFSPKKGGKAGGLRFAQKYFDFSEDETFISCNSGNDISMMKGKEAGVIVRNMTPDLQEWTSHKDLSIINTYVSEHNYADALIEGLRKYTNDNLK